MRLYEAILSDAMIMDHISFSTAVPFLERERMYPNYVGSEAVLASENLIPLQQHFCDEEAFNACLHPFIRNIHRLHGVCGTFLNKRSTANNDLAEAYARPLMYSNWQQRFIPKSYSERWRPIT